MNIKDLEAPVPYVKPSVETLSDQEIGPAQAYSGALPFSF